jgi:hypothetical protein
VEDARLEPFDFAALERRAQRQRKGLEQHRMDAARIAFEASG